MADRLDEFIDAFEKELLNLIKIYKSWPTDKHQIFGTVLKDVRHSVLFAKSALADPAPLEPDKPHPHAVWDEPRNAWFRWNELGLLRHRRPGEERRNPLWICCAIKDPDLIARCHAAAREGDDG